MNYLDDVKKLISYINEKYISINDEWSKNEKFYYINLKNTNVDKIYNDEKFLEYAFNYRDFINDKLTNSIDEIKKLGLNAIVEKRIKALNSIQYKIENYMINHMNGKEPINKCLNDICGFRIIFNNNINYDEIRNYIDTNFSDLKCISAIRNDYVAVHIYFCKGDNYRFQWELQIWDTNHQKSNLISHARYKQGYIEWEQKCLAR